MPEDATDRPAAATAGRPDGLADDGRPERLLIAARLDAADGAHRYLLARWPDWPHPSLLSVAAPRALDSLEALVADTLRARFSVECVGSPLKSTTRHPARMDHPRFGGGGLGWVRAVAVRVTGDPAPDALFASVDALSLDEALEALPTDLERAVLREAAGLLGD